MLIDDQINMMFDNPLVGVNDDALGPRFPDMSAPFDRELQRRAVALAMAAGFVLHRGVYVAVLGPNYETRAEYRMLRRLGGDAVGMSTVPEVIAARHAGMRCWRTTIAARGLRPIRLPGPAGASRGMRGGATTTDG
jgi:purine-nucleoside phosphorylase